MKKLSGTIQAKEKLKDAVKHIDGMITSDNEFFSNQTPVNTKFF